MNTKEMKDYLISSMDDEQLVKTIIAMKQLCGKENENDIRRVIQEVCKRTWTKHPYLISMQDYIVGRYDVLNLKTETVPSRFA